MRHNRVSYGKPIGWTLGNLREILQQMSRNGVHPDTSVRVGSCDCYEDSDEGGASLEDDGKTIRLRRVAGFEDKED